MKKTFFIGVVLLFVLIAPCKSVNAQDPITLVIKEGITKVIKAVDLKVQRLQNKTIWLQNAQKVIENAMTKARLDEITGWVERQRTLYQDYFDELSRVKSIISSYYRIREITGNQARLVAEYKRAYALFKQDKHFAAEELAYMRKVYTGILDASTRNLDQLFLVINSFATQMSGAKRLEIIDGAAEQLEANYADLKAFNQQNAVLSLQRAKSLSDALMVRQLYGLQ